MYTKKVKEKNYTKLEHKYVCHIMIFRQGPHFRCKNLNMLGKIFNIKRHYWADGQMVGGIGGQMVGFSDLRTDPLIDLIQQKSQTRI